MEMTLDVGRNLVTKLTEGASGEGVDREDFALNMMELGLRVFEASKEKSPEGDGKVLQLLLENNAMLQDITRCVFDKNKTAEKVFDAETLLTFIQNNVKSYLKGKAEGG